MKKISIIISILLSICLSLWFSCNPFEQQKVTTAKNYDVLDETDTLRASQADNPLFRNFRSADASPMVYNGRYYIVCGVDEANSSAFDMYSWRLLSSADMVSWTDHGTLLRGSDISWIPDNRCWASCIVARNGYFYFYATGDNMIGVMRASSITGPYTDVNGKPLITADTAGGSARDIDPHVFVDDDGQAYMIWGGDGICRMVKLNSNMTALSGSIIDVPGLTGSGYTYLEAPFIIKTNGTYFIIYADSPWPSKIHYATSSTIWNATWAHRGVIGAATGSGTNHSGAAYFNGQWWYCYHTEELSSRNPYSRCVCVDPMTISGNTISSVSYSSFY